MQLSTLRCELAQCFRNLGVNITDADTGRIIGGDINSPICGRLLHAWARCAQGPASGTAAWCWQGAPLGIKTDDSEPTGILPECKPGDVEDPESLVTDFDSFINYSGIEDDPDIISAVKGYVESNFLGEFNSLKGCEAYLGGPPVLNKLGKVVRHKWCGKTSRWITKNRLIMN